ncbi:hypothetical protein, partial [Thermococcus sp.]|uniref:hypothetical protein n=1 Tax=Thermococcus sp. TaxID=35749 RepID=UPI0026138985
LLPGILPLLLLFPFLPPIIFYMVKSFVFNSLILKLKRDRVSGKPSFLMCHEHDEEDGFPVPDGEI